MPFISTFWEAKSATVASLKAEIALGEHVKELTIVADAAVTLSNAEGGTAAIIPANTPVQIHSASTWSGTTMYFAGANDDIVTALVTYGYQNT